MEQQQFACFRARMDALQPAVPRWCKDEKMEMTVPETMLRHYGARTCPEMTLLQKLCVWLRRRKKQ